jgi:ABC-type multidrug transport system ATPase subunit
MKDPALRLERVTHRFGDLIALSDVDLHVGDGEIYGFLGLNGAGKTTAIRLILGLVRHRAGTIRIFGADTRHRPPELFRKVGVLFEDFAAHSYLSGRDHLRLHARFLGLSGAAASSAADRWLDRVGLARRGSTRVKGFSLGMRRRLGLACALVGSPRLVILDEPTNGLDPQGISDLRELILELNRNEGVTFFLSSHILGEVEQVCGRVGILHQGRMALEGSVADLTGRSKTQRRLRASPLDRARGLLECAAWCNRLELNGDNRSLIAEVAEEDVPRMVRELVTAGIDIHELSDAAESLESVFHRAVADAEASHPSDAGLAAVAAGRRA